MGLGIPPLNIKIMLESNPLKSTILVRRLAVLWYPIVSVQQSGAFVVSEGCLLGLAAGGRAAGRRGLWHRAVHAASPHTQSPQD